MLILDKRFNLVKAESNPLASSEAVDRTDFDPPELIDCHLPRTCPTMMTLRPCVIAAMLSLCGAGAIQPASFALATDPAPAPGTKDAAALSPAEQQFFEIVRAAAAHQALLPMSLVPGEDSQGWTAARQSRRMDEGRRQRSGDRPRRTGRKPADRSDSLPIARNAARRGSCEIRKSACWKNGSEWDAPDPRTDPVPEPSRTDPTSDAGRSHWSFQPIVEPPVPRVKNSVWPRSDIDRFILAKLESKGLSPVADADKPTLLRRVFFDLVGLPPTPADIESFLADDGPDAFVKIVDSLLGRAEFGQRWGRHWLDVARYADSNGSDENFTYYDAWRFRNYVIDAFNADKPFDRFLTEQLAGDLLPFSTQKERDNNIVATGFLVVGPKVIGATDKEQLLVDAIDEQVDTIGKTFLGLTIGCARCHDHKFDPISARDYYALAGILASTETIHGNLLNRRDLTGWNLHPLGPGGQAAYDAFLAHEKTLDGLEKEQKRLQTKRRRLEGVQPNPPTLENPEQRKPHTLSRNSALIPRPSWSRLTDGSLSSSRKSRS